MQLNSYEKSIIALLYVSNRPLTTNNISKIKGYAWITTKQYLLMLKSKKIVKCRRKSNRIFWWLYTIKEEEVIKWIGDN